MLIVPLVNAAAAAVTAVLALSSARNVLQTVQLSRADSAQPNGSASTDPPPILQRKSIGPMDPAESVVRKLQSFKRDELFDVYFGSRAPDDLSEIEGEWDGMLLDNNGWIMTSVSGLISNRLFGRGRMWNGKQFFSNAGNGEGINRLRLNGNNNPQRLPSQTEKEHQFEMSLIASKVGAKQVSLVLDYTQHQSRGSPWRTMKDEIRIIPLDGDVRVLIGLGYMAWSGGRFNAQPFVLYRPFAKAAENSAAE